MRKYLFYLFVVLCSFTSINAQSIYVNLSNGDIEIFPLSSVKKITFIGDDMVLTKTDNSTIQWDIFSIENYSYKEFTAIEETIFQEHNLFPCPFTDKFNISYVVDKGGSTVIEIFDISGKRVYQNEVVSVEGENKLEISHLQQFSKGNYYCTISLDNDFIDFKLIKK